MLAKKTACTNYVFDILDYFIIIVLKFSLKSAALSLIYRFHDYHCSTSGMHQTQKSCESLCRVLNAEC